MVTDNRLDFADGNTGNERYRGVIQYAHGDDSMTFGTAGNTTALTLSSTQNATFAGDILLTSGTDYKPQLVIENTNANDRSPYLVFKKNSASPANNDGIGLIEFYGRDNTSSSRLMASIEASSPNVTDYDGKITFSTVVGGTMAARMLIDESGYIIFNHHTKILNGQIHHGVNNSGAMRRLIGFDGALCRINDEDQNTLIGKDGTTVTIGGNFAVDEDSTFAGTIGSGAITSTAGISGTTGTFSAGVSGTTGAFSGAVTGASYSGGTITGTTSTFTYAGGTRVRIGSTNPISRGSLGNANATFGVVGAEPGIEIYKNTSPERTIGIRIGGFGGSDVRPQLYYGGQALRIGYVPAASNAALTNVLTLGIDGNATFGGDLTVTGGLTINGTTTTVSTTNMVVSDNMIELNNGASSNANDSGIVIERGSTGDNAIFAWDESVDGFIVGTTTATGASTGNLTIAAAPLQTAALTATTGTFTGDVTITKTGEAKFGISGTTYSTINFKEGGADQWNVGYDAANNKFFIAEDGVANQLEIADGGNATFAGGITQNAGNHSFH